MYYNVLVVTAEMTDKAMLRWQWDIFFKDLKVLNLIFVAIRMWYNNIHTDVVFSVLCAELRQSLMKW